MKKIAWMILALVLIVGGVRATSLVNVGTTNISTNSATAVFLVSALSSNSQGVVYYGPVDAGTNALSWARSVSVGSLSVTGTYTAPLTALMPSGFYMFRAACETNGNRAWAPSSYAFWTRASASPSNPTNPTAPQFVTARTNGEVVSPAALDDRVFKGETAYGWGDHSTAGYAIQSNLQSVAVGVVTGIIVNAALQSGVILSLTNDIIMAAPTNAIDGKRLSWRMTAVDDNRSVTWPTNVFRIPSTSTMSNTVVIATNTTSLFLIEYDAGNNRWLLESYIGGY